jgi:hypothetical protein
MSRAADVLDLRAQVVRLARDLGADELRCLRWIGRRLAAGALTYGRLHLRRDGRDFVLEAELHATVATTSAPTPGHTIAPGPMVGAYAHGRGRSKAGRAGEFAAHDSRRLTEAPRARTGGRWPPPRCLRS